MTARPRSFGEHRVDVAIARAVKHTGGPRVTRGVADDRLYREKDLDEWNLATCETRRLYIMSEVVKQAADAVETLATAAESITNSLNAFKAIAAKTIDDVRAVRMSLTTEHVAVTKQLVELRQIVGADFKAELEHMKELIGLCREMKKLHDEGVLDVLADVLIRLMDAKR